MITEDFVSYPVAKLLKKKGFTEKCIAFYNSLGQLETIDTILSLEGNHQLSYYYRSLNTPEWMEEMCSAPTQALVVKWLRIKYGIHIFTDFGLNWGYYIVPVGYTGEGTFPKPKEGFDTPEQAVEAAIEYCLNNLIK